MRREWLWREAPEGRGRRWGHTGGHREARFMGSGAGSARQSRNTRGGGKSAKKSSSTRRMRARLQGRVRLRVVSGCGSYQVAGRSRLRVVAGGGSFSCGSGRVAGRIRGWVGSGGGSYQVAGRSVTLRVGSGYGKGRGRIRWKEARLRVVSGRSEKGWSGWKEARCVDRVEGAGGE